MMSAASVRRCHRKRTCAHCELHHERLLTVHCRYCADARREGVALLMWRYCNFECFERAWPAHRMNCPLLRHKYTCANCSVVSMAAKFKHCSGCEVGAAPRTTWAHYCSETCQREHWRNCHRWVCFRNRAPLMNDTSTIAPSDACDGDDVVNSESSSERGEQEVF